MCFPAPDLRRVNGFHVFYERYIELFACITGRISLAYLELPE